MAILFFPLPIVPTVLLVAGLLILSANHAWASTVLRKVQAKFPSLFPEKARAITTAKPA